MSRETYHQFISSSLTALPETNHTAFQRLRYPLRMAFTESYTCDICGDKKGDSGQWFLSWLDCLPSGTAGTQPVVKLTRWNSEHAHTPNVQHLCGARCAGTMMDRWMSEQHEDPTATCN